MQEVEEDAAVIGHRAGDVAERYHRRRLDGAGGALGHDQFAAGAHRRAHRAPRIEGAARGGDAAALAGAVAGEGEAGEGAARRFQFRRRHLGEVLGAQDLARRGGEAGVDFDLGPLLLRRPAGGLHGVGDTRGAGAGLFILLPLVGDGRQELHHLVEEVAAAEEGVEGGIEHGKLVALVDEDGAKGGMDVRP